MRKPAPWRVPYSSAAEFVREHYTAVFGWCLQITGDDVHEAEDLIQDAFVLLSHSQVSTEDMQNVKGYIYVLLRNLHRSRYERGRRHVPLPILDYDCARLGLSVVDSSHLVIVADQLRRICDFACERKETSRGGSVLILRFFHGYYPSEIAAILVSSRHSVDEYLHCVRREARDHLAGVRKAPLLDAKSDPGKAERLAGRMMVSETTESLLDELQQNIFASCRPTCPSVATLERWYRPESLSPVPVDTLAHIVSCPVCLDEVNRLLNLPPLNTRNPSDSAGKESGSGLTLLSRSSRKGGGSHRNSALKRLDHMAGEIFEHRPETLCVAVNGQPVASQPVSGSRSEITVRLQQSTGIDFIEVFSEQDVRLLMIPIRELPPSGPFEQSAVTCLSEGRELKATFRYTSPWPSVHISYDADVPVPLAIEARSVPGFAKLPPKPKRWLPSTGRLPFRWVSATIGLLAIVLYLIEQTGYNTAQARTLIEQCNSWEASVQKTGQTVLRQRFDFGPRNSPRGSHEVVEVWRGSGRQSRLVRHLDKSGRLLGTSDRPLPSAAALPPDQIWQFEPSAETFAAFAQPQERLRVHENGDDTDIEAARITLTLDANTHRPVGEVLHSEGRDFEFVETSFDLVPATDSPIPPATRESTEPNRVAIVTLPSVPLGNRTPSLPTVAQLDLAELQARVALHTLQMDLHDVVRFQQTPDGVTADILVETRGSRDKILAALGGIPLVRPRLKVIEELTPAIGAASPPPANPPADTSTRYEPLMEPYLKGQLGSAAAVNQVMAAAARASDDLLHRAVAISQLAERYSATTISTLPPDARLELLKLVQNHIDEFAVERRSFDAMTLDLIRPVAGAGQGVTTAGESAAGWTSSSAALLDTVQTIHSLCSSLFVETTQLPTDTLPNVASRLLEISQRVQAEAEDVRRSLATLVSQ